MYEVASRTRRVNGVDVETWARGIIDANILSVEAGTNGYQGGDADYGGRTYIRINDGVAHVHDEIIIECDRRMAADTVCEQMSRTPPWARGLELNADGFECEFYRKD